MLVDIPKRLHDREVQRRMAAITCSGHHLLENPARRSICGLRPSMPIGKQHHHNALAVDRCFQKAVPILAFPHKRGGAHKHGCSPRRVPCAAQRVPRPQTTPRTARPGQWIPVSEESLDYCNTSPS